MGWIKRIFGVVDSTADRVQAAGDRIATAAEEIASDWEAMLAAHRARLGAAPILVIEDRSAAAEPSRNGRRKTAAV